MPPTSQKPILWDITIEDLRRLTNDSIPVESLTPVVHLYKSGHDRVRSLLPGRPALIRYGDRETTAGGDRYETKAH